MLGDALKYIRLFYRLNQKELSEKIGMSVSYLSEIEQGKKKPSLEVIEKYSTHFDVPVSSIMLFSEELANDGLKEKLRVKMTGKMLKIMEWIVESSEDKKDA